MRLFNIDLKIDFKFRLKKSRGKNEIQNMILKNGQNFMVL